MENERFLFSWDTYLHKLYGEYKGEDCTGSIVKQSQRQLNSYHQCPSSLCVHPLQLGLP